MSGFLSWGSKKRKNGAKSIDVWKSIYNFNTSGGCVGPLRLGNENISDLRLVTKTRSDLPDTSTPHIYLPKEYTSFFFRDENKQGRGRFNLRVPRRLPASFPSQCISESPGSLYSPNPLPISLQQRKRVEILSNKKLWLVWVYFPIR